MGKYFTPSANSMPEESWASICGICLEAFSWQSASRHEPRVLRCGHTFCTKCIKSMLNHAIRDAAITAKCPTCRQDITDALPVNGDARHFPVNFELVETLEALKDTSSPPSEDKENTPLKAKSIVDVRVKTSTGKRLIFHSVPTTTT